MPKHARGRAVTWLEMRFDPTFVIAVEQLSGAHAHQSDGDVAAGSALFLLAT